MSEGKCPHCGETLSLSQRAVDEKLACPRCGGTFAAWQAAAAATPVAIPVEPLDVAPAAPRSRRSLVVGVFVGVSALAVGLVALFLLKDKPASASSGLEYVPGDAAGFLSIRLNEVWRSSLANEQRSWFGEQIDQALEQCSGLQMGDLERITIVLPKAPERARDAEFWAILKTKKKYDAARLRAGCSAEVIEQTHNGKECLVGVNGALHFLAEDLLVFGTPGGMRDFLSRDDVARGPLRAHVPLAEKNAIVLAVTSPWSKGKGDDYDEATWPKLPDVREARGFVLAMNPTDTGKSFELTVELQSELAASEVEPAFVDSFKSSRRLKECRVSRQDAKITVKGEEPHFTRDVVFKGKHFVVTKGKAYDPKNREPERAVHSLTYRGTHLGNHFLAPDNPAVPDWGRLATTYYARRSPVGVVLEKFNWFPGKVHTFAADARLPASLAGLGVPGACPLPLDGLSVAWSEPPIGVVGLNVGTMGSYARPYQHMHFFVAHPDFVELSLPKEGQRPWFRYLLDAKARGAQLRIETGEPRLLLNAAAVDDFFHAIVLDVYRDGVETVQEDLLTKEAMELLLKKLAPGGILCFHTSNRYYQVAEVVEDVANSLGCASRRGKDSGNLDEAQEHTSSEWVMVARREGDLRHLTTPEGYRPLFPGAAYWTSPRPSGEHVWTDKARSFFGLFFNDPWIQNIVSGLQRHDLERFPGLPSSVAAYALFVEPPAALGRFVVDNRNRK